MTTSGEAVPSDVLTVDEMGATTVLRVAADAYPPVALYGAAYVFLDRCWVLLDRPDASHVRITLAPRAPGASPAHADVASEFAEELVSCAWRTGVARATRELLDAATSTAHGAGGDMPPSIDDLETFDFAADAKDAMNDPLGLAQSWEEKHDPGPGKDA